MKKQLNIGLFGGSFDPVHCGHLELARTAGKELGLDKVIFIPAKNPPHKLKKKLAPAPIRLKMLSAGLKPYKDFSISRYELERKGTTYTYQTVAHFKKLYPFSKLFFIIGMDSLVELKTWKKIGGLLKQVQFAATGRAGVKTGPKKPFSGSIIFLKGKPPAVSSTAIRQMAAEGRSLKGLVPGAVEKIVDREGLYRQDPFDEILSYLKTHLDGARFAHTLGTSRLAAQLAEKYGIPRGKAVVAALLHDAGKGFDKSAMMKYTLRRDLKIPEKKMVFKYNPSLLHSYISADIAKRKFRVTDPDILSAIVQHTVGGESMSTLAKIIYIADAVAPERRFRGLKILRRLAFTDLDAAIREAMAHKHYHVVKNRRWLHPEAVKAWNSMVKA